MLKTRVITAVVLLSVFIPILLFSPTIILSLVVSIIISLASWEWGRFIWGVKSRLPIFYSVMIQALLVLLIYCIEGNNQNVITLFSYLMLGILWVSMIFWLIVVPFILSKKLQFSIKTNTPLLAIAGVIIFLSDWYAFMLLKDKGLWVLLSVLMIVWTADIGAYFVGKQIGKNKLAPQLSPGKSIEGVIGGMLAVCILGCIFFSLNISSMNFFNVIGQQSSWIVLIPLCIFLAGMSVVGDLFESQLKRISGMKDSSGLLPGHGGVMDRLDALLPVLPIAAICIQGIS
ncbi:phosphatidate cytidylyltransferase [Polynucleobacter sp. SHI8]|uniref:phosphatidate cytidylyltransferase n=1 Tax=unclassified Polynucleobacter TaxID=2640945 RepID=UPI002491064A|nr:MULTISPECIES: phosphatidate cytidylyltransferase [unclassified Polynucleobacter]BDW11166.1 phosphatidate cytidylyltransferase [Polynucleobacter sp. SHI2]BDW13612.1 phosphatidate cytidylyltransferase [Polynucleobacter sp. SHI8]